MSLADLPTLDAQLAALPSDLRRRLDARGFDPSQLARWAADDRSADERNRISGRVEPVPQDMLEPVPEPGTEAHAALSKRGAEALASGQLAVCVLAGGMATRMGGVVKALLEVVGGHSFLDLRLAEMSQVGREQGRVPPLWLMTSEPTEGPTREALAGRGVDAATFEQFLSLRLDLDGRLWLDDDGRPSVYATGHGDLPDALRRTPLLDRFIEGGGRYVWISNLDNIGASVDPAVLGAHVQSADPVTVEVCDKHPGDKGGGPVLHDGEPIVCETFRLPGDFDPDRVSVFNTNTFIVDAVALRELDLDWTYVRVQKEVRDRTALQFERLLGEITVALRPRFSHVSRSGERSRFLPVKSYDDLEAIRGEAARRARARGLSV